MHEFKLPSSLTISNCNEVLSDVVEAKKNNEKIQLDSSEVETIDTAGIQLICSICKDEDRVKHANLSEKVKAVMNDLNLTAN